MNGADSPFNVVFLIKITEIIATMIPTRYIEYVMTSTCLNPKAIAIPPAIAVKIGSLAPHEKNGMTRIVAVLSLSSASVLVLTIAGTEQPNPMIIGMKALPDKPNFLNNLSKIKATRAIYPVSSMIAKNKNKTRICGRNPKMANKPARTPSQIKPLNHAGAFANAFSTTSVIAAKLISKKLKRITPIELIPLSDQNSPS